MSHILKALNKARKDNVREQSVDSEVVAQHAVESAVERSHDAAHTKTIDYQLIFMGVLTILVATGVYLNHNISMNLAKTQIRMTTISDNFYAQQEKLNSLNTMIQQMDLANNGQNKEFLTKIDTLSLNVKDQISEIRELSKSQYSELSKTIEEQQQSIASLTTQYELLDKTVRNFTDVNANYIEQLNLLKKKMTEMNPASSSQ